MEKNIYEESTSINTLFWNLEIDGIVQPETYYFKQKKCITPS